MAGPSCQHDDAVEQVYLNRKRMCSTLNRQYRQPTRQFVDPEWGATRQAIADVFEMRSTKVFMGLLVGYNMVVMILETNMRSDEDMEIPMWIVASTYLLLLAYAVELAAKLYTYQKAFRDNIFNVIDACIVAADVAVLLLEQFFGDLPVSLTVLRATRVFRLVRVIREILIFRELYLMMQGLLSAIRSIAFGATMLFVTLTMWSMLAVEILHPLNKGLADAGIYGDCYDCREAFSTVWRSNLTFAKTIIAGDSWGQLAVPLMAHYPAVSLIILPAFITVQLGLVNVIVAVIVDRQAQARIEDEALVHAEREEELSRSYKRLKTMFDKMDDDGGGTLSWSELMESYEEVEEFQAMLTLMDVKREDMPMVFAILDPDESGDVNYGEFVEKLHYIRHINMRTLLVFIKQTMLEMSKTQDYLKCRLDRLGTATGEQNDEERSQSGTYKSRAELLREADLRFRNKPCETEDPEPVQQWIMRKSSAPKRNSKACAPKVHIKERCSPRTSHSSENEPRARRVQSEPTGRVPEAVAEGASVADASISLTALGGDSVCQEPSLVKAYICEAECTPGEALQSSHCEPISAGSRIPDMASCCDTAAEENQRHGGDHEEMADEVLEPAEESECKCPAVEGVEYVCEEVDASCEPCDEQKEQPWWSASQPQDGPFCKFREAAKKPRRCPHKPTG